MKISEINYLPQKPGIYKFYDKSGRILYVGKALSLRNRVQSYFSDSLSDRPYVKKMVPQIFDIEVVQTNNEIESLVLESNLIKKYKPKYNSDLKDDKSYVWIFVSTKDDFPSVKIIRNISNDELQRGKLFGPYPNSHSAKRVFTYLRKLYPFCTCTSQKANKEKKCMYYHLGLCPGPYQGLISKEEYRKNIKEIINFLKGKKRGHILTLEKEMKEYSKIKEYEKAAEVRDKIEDLKYLGESIDFRIGDNEESYVDRRKRVLLRNFSNLKTELGIDELERIECYDISNIQGKEAYGSMVVAEDGEIRRGEYRIFRIKSMDTPNDMHMLKEVLERRFDIKNISKYKKSPEIILIDGGKAQLSVVKSVVPHHIFLMGISKGKKYKRKGGRLIDEFWIFDKKTKKIVNKRITNSSILVDLRDEAHRFAILFHRKARVKKGLQSELLKIEGVGQKSKSKLIKYFKSVEKIKEGTREEINIALNNRRIAENVFRYFNKKV